MLQSGQAERVVRRCGIRGDRFEIVGMDTIGVTRLLHEVGHLGQLVIPESIRLAHLGNRRRRLVLVHFCQHAEVCRSFQAAARD